MGVITDSFSLFGTVPVNSDALPAIHVTTGDPSFNCAPTQFHHQCPCFHIYPYLSISIHIYPYLSISIHIHPYPSISIHIYPYLFRSIHIYPYLSIYTWVLHVSFEQSIFWLLESTSRLLCTLCSQSASNQWRLISQWRALCLLAYGNWIQSSAHTH